MALDFSGECVGGPWDGEIRRSVYRDILVLSCVPLIMSIDDANLPPSAPTRMQIVGYYRFMWTADQLGVWRWAPDDG